MSSPFGFVEMLSFCLFWICWNVLNLFLFYLANGGSLGHLLPTRPLFWKKRNTHLITLLGHFEMFLIYVLSILRFVINYFFSIWRLWNCLDWFLFYLDLYKLSQLTSFLFGCVALSWIDLFSILSLGHHWGTLCQPDPAFDKKSRILI